MKEALLERLTFRINSTLIMKTLGSQSWFLTCFMLFQDAEFILFFFPNSIFILRITTILIVTYIKLIIGII